mmetsp:Transcript_56898/g.149882  ORF Transcript_56898/g.149882 Transcript_56898/m.149882 type:complete len:124 (-) Transcript_56898:213-584(-)
MHSISPAIQVKEMSGVDVKDAMKATLTGKQIKIDIIHTAFAHRVHKERRYLVAFFGGGGGKSLNRGIRSEFVSRRALVRMGAQLALARQSFKASAKSAGTLASAISFACVPKVFSSKALAACR